MKLRDTEKQDDAKPKERLACAAIKRDGVEHGRDQQLRAHWALRASLGDHDPYNVRLSDEEGFITSSGRFVTREEAHDIALASGQLHAALRNRRLLSSDLRWDA